MVCNMNLEPREANRATDQNVKTVSCGYWIAASQGFRSLSSSRTTDDARQSAFSVVSFGKHVLAGLYYLAPRSLQRTEYRQ